MTASSVAADNSFAVTEVKMISEHCATAAVAPAASISTPADTPTVVAAATAAAVPTPAETASAPVADAAAPAGAVPTPPQPEVNLPSAAAASPAAVPTPAEACERTGCSRHATARDRHATCRDCRDTFCSRRPNAAVSTTSETDSNTRSCRHNGCCRSTCGDRHTGCRRCHTRRDRQHACGYCERTCCSRHDTRGNCQEQFVVALDSNCRVGAHHGRACPSPQPVEKTKTGGAVRHPKSLFLASGKFRARQQRQARRTQSCLS